MSLELALGVSLASVCLLGALIHLAWFMTQVNGTMKTMSELIADLIKNPNENATTLRYAVAARIALMRQSLVASGIMVGVTFGFVGFALFVMGITGAADLEGGGGGYSLVLKNAAPGLIVLVVSAGLIGVCVIQRVAVEFTPSPQPSGAKLNTTQGPQTPSSG